jgi:DNA-binding FadR family transcriptional regulator
MKRSLEEHRGIVEAIQSRDAQLAHQVAREHIENAENSMIEAIKIDGLPLSD